MVQHFRPAIGALSEWLAPSSPWLTARSLEFIRQLPALRVLKPSGKAQEKRASLTVGGGGPDCLVAAHACFFFSDMAPLSQMPHFTTAGRG